MMRTIEQLEAGEVLTPAEALDLLATDEAMAHPDAALEVLGLTHLRGATPAQIRREVGSMQAIVVKMHRGGGPNGSW